MRAARPRTRVAVVAAPGAADPCGFLPFEDPGSGHCGPIGHTLTDHQGLVATAPVDAASLVRGMGAASLRFDHLTLDPTNRTTFARAISSTAPSPLVDLRAGADAWLDALRSRGSTQEATAANLRRRLEREHGPVRFVAHDADGATLARLRSWKSGQYRATGAADLFAEPWAIELTYRVASTGYTPETGFGGVLSALWAGDSLIAAHLGLRSATVLHYWLPAYDPAFARFSPGISLLLDLARAAPAQGIDSIDLGKGDEHYKRRLSTASVDVAVARVEATTVSNTARRVVRGARSRARRATSRLRGAR